MKNIPKLRWADKLVWLIPLCVSLMLVSLPARAGEVVFMTPLEGAERLAKRDRYLEAFTPFDWASRQGANEPLSDEELLSFYQGTVLKWKGTNRSRVLAATKKVLARMAALGLAYGDPVNFILTNGAEEGNGGAPYTRQDFIVLPTSFLDRVDDDKLAFVVAHEIFHVFSRKYQDQRDRLYAVIGFEPGPELVFPERIRDLKITNPDAVIHRHYFRAEYAGKERQFVPVIYANRPFEPDFGMPFFGYLELKMMAVKPDGDRMIAEMKSGNLILLSPNSLPELEKITGGNTNYYFHPEEVLADNFALFVMKMPLRDHAIPDELIRVMKSITG